MYLLVKKGRDHFKEVDGRRILKIRILKFIDKY
jgi:hypothetical protein